MRGETRSVPARSGGMRTLTIQNSDMSVQLRARAQPSSSGLLPILLTTASQERVHRPILRLTAWSAVSTGIPLVLFVPTHPPTSQNHFPCHVTKGDSQYAGIGDHGYTPVTAGKRPTGNPADRFSGFGGKRLTPRQTPFPPMEELPPSGPPPARRTT